MKQFLYLLKYELRCLFWAPSTYITTILFLLLMGFFYFIILQDFTHNPQNNLLSTEFFRLFWIPTLFIIPLLTMKSLSEERRLGTLETLLTTPTSTTTIVLSKFFSILFFYTLLWNLTLLYPLIIKYILPYNTLSKTLDNPASIIGSITFIIISSTLYISIGIFTSSLTRSQLISGMLTFTLLFLILTGSFILLNSPLPENTLLKSFNFQTWNHLDNFSQGILDSRPLFFYISTTTLILGLTSLTLETKIN